MARNKIARLRRALTGMSFIALTAAGDAPAPNVKMAPESMMHELAPQKEGEHRIWINDYSNGLYARSILVDADDGDWLGSVDTGWEGEKLEIPARGKEFYNAGMFLSRGFRGERADVVEIFDKATLSVQGEIKVPPKMIRGWPNLNHTALTDDDRFLLLQFFTPASSVGVVDLRSRAYVDEIETAGCAHVMAIAARGFAVLCGDGSLLKIEIDDNGREIRRERHPLFDADADPLHETAVRIGDIWYLVSHLGVVHPLDVTGGKPRALPSWSLSEAEDGKRWIPAQIIQNIAIHAKSGRLFALMHLASLEPKGGGTDYHRPAGTEIWVFDIASKRRLARFPLSRPTDAIAISQDAAPYLYAATFWSTEVQVLDAATGKLLRNIDGGFTPGILQPVEAP